jgi:hypothetical protein
MYAQAAIKPNSLLRNGAYGIVMRGVQKCTCAGASLKGRISAPLCCIKLDTATDDTCGTDDFLTNTNNDRIVKVECGNAKYMEVNA